MSRFRRELRYLVFKLKDIDRYLSPREREMLASIENKIIAARDKERRPQLSTVVVERDWPEFEIVWGLLEARMLGVKNKYEVEIELIQSELNEQARLLGMSAERELKLLTEIERLRAEIKTMREQGPVGEVLDVGINGQSYGTSVRLHKPLKPGTKLYLAAGAPIDPPAEYKAGLMSAAQLVELKAVKFAECTGGVDYLTRAQLGCYDCLLELADEIRNLANGKPQTDKG